MFRYLAILPDRSNTRQLEVAAGIERALRASSPEWVSVIDDEDLRVYTSASANASGTALRLHGNAGVLVGTVFESVAGSVTPRLARFGEAASVSIRQSAGRNLLSQCWGSYVAFIRDRDGNRRIIKDPSGTLDCMTTTLDGVRVFFSSMHDCRPLEQGDYSINWERMLADSLCCTMESRETALNEVRQVLRGECITVRPNADIASEFYWNPLTVSSTEPIDDYRVACGEVRRVTMACVTAWARRYRNIMHLLSGGLDSSIVLACLAQEADGDRLLAVNHYYGADSCSDERVFARKVAQHVGCRFMDYETAVPELTHHASIRPRMYPYPYECIVQRNANVMEHQIALTSGATGRFCGFGGDQIYYQIGAEYVLGDFLHRHGVGRGFYQVLKDAALNKRLTLWRVLQKAFQQRRAGSPLKLLHQALQNFDESDPGGLIERDFARSVWQQRFMLHPWFEVKGSYSLATYWHVASLASNDGVHGMFSDAADAEDVSPLFMQPLMELCVRIAPYLHVRGERDRSTARAGFEDLLPKEILNRRTKGTPIEYPKAILTKNRAFLREVLFDGQLVRRGIVSRPKLEAAFSGFTREYGFLPQVCMLASTELWLMNWDQARLREAA